MYRYRLYLILLLFILLCIMIVYTSKQKECFKDINIVSDNLPPYKKEKKEVTNEPIVGPMLDNYFRDNIVGYYEGGYDTPSIKSTYEQCIETARNYNKKNVISEYDKYVAIGYRNNAHPEPLTNTCVYYKMYFNANTLNNDGDNALRYNTFCVEQDKNISDGCV